MYIIFFTGGIVSIIDDKENIINMIKKCYSNNIQLFEYSIYHIESNMIDIINMFIIKKYDFNKLYFDKDFTVDEIIKINGFF